MRRRHLRLEAVVAMALAVALAVLLTPSPLDRAEHPTTDEVAAPVGSWRTLAPSQVKRQEGAYVQVDGRFYLAGGGTVHESYDPLTDGWETLAPLPADLDHIQSVAVDGLIYYVGGLSSWPAGNVATVHIYDPETDRFRAGAAMPNGGQGAGGVAVHDGRIYYAGGTRGVSGGTHNGADALDEFLVYDPATDVWAALDPMPRERDHFHAVVADGRFWAIGGRDVAIDATRDEVDAYDFTTETWETLDSRLPTPRGGFAAGVLGDEILIIGGEGGGTTFGVVEAYDISSDTWRRLAPMPTPRHGIQAAQCQAALYVAAGGTTQGGSNPGTAHEAFSFGDAGDCRPSADDAAPEPEPQP